MYIQRNPNASAADWWNQETVLSISRRQFAWVMIWLAIAVSYGITDWDWAFGRR